DEIRRASVRGFMRALVALVRPRAGGVLLLSHIDKSAARGQSNQSYSGSTAWHNSARSRLFLKQEHPGELELLHEKSNFGRRLEPLRLRWPEEQLPEVERSMSPLTTAIKARGDTKALLALIHAFAARSEFIAPERRSTVNVTRVLKGERGYPKGASDGE